MRPLIVLVALGTGLSAACGGGQSEGAAGAPGAGRGGAPGGVPVEIVTLELRPIEDISEYVGTVKSRRSSPIQPQVEGFLRSASGTTRFAGRTWPVSLYEVTAHVARPGLEGRDAKRASSAARSTLVMSAYVG